MGRGANREPRRKTSKIVKGIRFLPKTLRINDREIQGWEAEHASVFGTNDTVTIWLWAPNPIAWRCQIVRARSQSTVTSQLYRSPSSALQACMEAGP